MNGFFRVFEAWLAFAMFIAFIIVVLSLIFWGKMRYQLKRDNVLVKHITFQASNDNYAPRDIKILEFTSFKQANELKQIWPDIEVIEVVNE